MGQDGWGSNRISGGTTLYLLLNFAVNLQMQKVCLLGFYKACQQSCCLTVLITAKVPDSRQGASLPLGYPGALSAQKPPWRQEWAEGQRQAG